MTIMRKFRPWSYSVSHSELVLRTVPQDAINECVEIRFYGVVSMKLKSVYSRLELLLATPSESNHILHFSGVADSQTSRVHCIILGDDKRESFVACLSYRAWAFPGDSHFTKSGLPEAEAKLILSS